MPTPDHPTPAARRLAALAAATGLLAAAAAVALAPDARADSISYVRDGNVFVTSPDGERTVQLTARGGYSSASQADDGRVLALHGQRFHLIGRDGRLQADFTPVGSGTAGTITMNGPFDPAISPDGTTVAYGFYVQYKSGDPNCGKPGGCMVGQLYAGTGYSRADGPVEWGQDGYKPEYGWTDPSWLDAGRTLIAGADSAYITDLAIDTPADGQNAAQWFSDPSPDSRVLHDAEMNRQGSGVAAVTNSEGDHLRIWRLTGPPVKDQVPEPCLDAPAQGGAWSSPSWAPDGERLVAASGKGLIVATLPGFAGACPSADKVGASLIVPAGAKSPDWGPADVPAQPDLATVDTPQTQGTAGPQPTTQPGPTTSPQPQGRAPRLRVTRARLATVLRRGLLVRAVCDSGSATITARDGARVVARATARCGRDVRLRPNAAQRARLARKRSLTLALEVVAPGGRATTRVTLRR